MPGGAASAPLGCAIMADIAANLGDCELGAAAVAQRQHVTPRYIHRLFESDGLTFSFLFRGFQDRCLQRLTLLV